MASSFGRSRGLRLAGIVLVNLVLFIGLIASAEAVLHRVYNWQNPLLVHGETPLRPRHPVFTHTLAPKFDGYDNWGSASTRVVTNSLGFKDASTRDVPLVSDRKRVVFIGDSFTEGVGLLYEESFVGRFARAFPELDVLNAGVSSYAPSVYFEKLKFYLDAGLKFDEAIVYIDISDIQDEGIFYRNDASGALQFGVFTADPVKCLPQAAPLFGPPERSWLDKNSFIVEFVHKLLYARQLEAANERASFEELARPGRAFSRDWVRAAWTYDDKAGCYGPGGVEAAVEKAKAQMDRLHELLSSKGVALSVGVYPWPQQLLYDEENSRQARIWREWCAGKCARFFDHFPVFHRYKETHPDFLRDLYIWADCHFNANGDRLLADDLIAQYSGDDAKASSFH